MYNCSSMMHILTSIGHFYITKVIKQVPYYYGVAKCVINMKEESMA